jgi:cilia- and flagella-associated protein 43
METVGQVIKTFLNNSLLNRKLEISNYPIRKRSKNELLAVENIKRFRRVQMGVLAAIKPKDEHVNDTNEEPITETAIQINSSEEVSENSILLYHSLELNTKERRRLQSILLKETILDLQKTLNSNFKTLVSQKQDEIAKIEEKNDRIMAIIAQLQVLLALISFLKM